MVPKGEGCLQRYPAGSSAGSAFGGFGFRVDRGLGFRVWGLGYGVLGVNPIKLETGLRLNSAGIPYTLLFRIEAIGFPTFGLLL